MDQLSEKSMYAIIFAAMIIGLAVFGSGIVALRDSHGPRERHPRPKNWAKPVKKTALKNFFQVSDNLYRGAQPTTADAIKELDKKGIKTIVNLRSHHSDEKLIGDTKINYVNIKMKAHSIEDEDLINFLKIVTDKEKGPVFVHCWHGSDRTGAACAIYRVAVQGWSKKQALEEMTEGGYSYNEIWTNIIEYFQKLDIKDIKKRAGLK